jgi:drug/metabolite transporter (DMT)-like permease
LALRRVPAHQAALLTLLEPLLVPLWTYLAVGERVPTATAIGGAIILTSLILLLAAAARRPNPS